jgi:hypothetical protein
MREQAFRPGCLLHFVPAHRSGVLPQFVLRKRREVTAVRIRLVRPWVMLGNCVAVMGLLRGAELQVQKPSLSETI